MITQYFTYGILITISSWIFGILLSNVLRKTEYYKYLPNLNLILSRTFNKRIGLKLFKWIVRNTFFQYFNTKLKLRTRSQLNDLDVLRKEMTLAEINHLIGFGFVTIFSVVKFISGNYLFALIFMIGNIFLNLYPSLLQQENKRRIDKFLENYN